MLENKLEEYLIKYLFNRFNVTISSNFEGNSRIITVDGKKIIIPDIPRKENAIEIDSFGVRVPYFRYDKSISFNESSTEIILTYDIIGEIYDHLTLVYEKEGIIDVHSKLVFYPILDMKIYNLFLQLKETLSLQYKMLDNKQFLVGVSHDIDRTGDSFKYRIITYFFQTLKQKRPSLIFKGIFGRNEEANFDYILEKEKEYGASSTWFVLTRYGLKLNADYHLKDKEFNKAVKQLISSNKEIGVHIPFMDLTVPEIKGEFEKLKDHSPKGMRMHHLRGDYDQLMELLNESDIVYDSTFGYNECIAYRFGTSIPFHPIINGQLLDNIYEIPMNIMDLQILDTNEYEKQLTQLFTILREVRGVCILNWHNNRFNKTKYGDIWIETFNISLKEASKQNGLLTDLSTILKLYT